MCVSRETASGTQTDIATARDDGGMGGLGLGSRGIVTSPTGRLLVVSGTGIQYATLGCSVKARRERNTRFLFSMLQNIRPTRCPSHRTRTHASRQSTACPRQARKERYGNWPT